MNCRLPIADFRFDPMRSPLRHDLSGAGHPVSHSFGNQQSTIGNRAFTLIELLTVIGIIAILAAIISIAVNVVGNNASARRTKVAIENALGLQKEYENAKPLAGQLKTQNVVAGPTSTYAITGSAMTTFLQIPANKQSFERMASNMVATLTATDVQDWAAATTYVAGDLVEHAGGSGTLYRAVAGSTGATPPGAAWVAYTGSLVCILDGWGKPLAYVGGTLTGVTKAGVTGQTVAAPTLKPFWVSAGPDGDFQTHDDNVYSFEN